MNDNPLTMMGAPLPARDPAEPHRASTPLELFYDLVSVIAIAAAASLLHHGLMHDHFAQGIMLFLMTFWSIWWAWMNFTWFASAYDSDDLSYRAAVFIQIVGALIMAAGIQGVFTDFDFRIVAIGFVVMRVLLVSLWLRVAKSDLIGRSAALRNGIGIVLCQIGWVVLVFVLPKSLLIIGFFIMATAEHTVPVLAQRVAAMTWHRGHIIERYGLLTLIVLGESMLAAHAAIVALIAQFNIALLTSLVGGLLTLFAMWWLYFDEAEHNMLNTPTGAFLWGYGHFAIFASAAAVGAGLSVVTDQLQHNAEIGTLAANTCVAIPVATYLLALWFVHELPAKLTGCRLVQFPIAALLISATPFWSHGVLLTGMILAVLLILRLRSN
ncbi:MAG: low temperature requirement protein A [Candidatus Thiodiazotropha sp. (ex. Lucinisca nassula)]|nr:low temperature requirement protein A [Candidatus Thiodiazotropha sp. (ex. Lucinisca nassula)]